MPGGSSRARRAGAALAAIVVVVSGVVVGTGGVAFPPGAAIAGPAAAPSAGCDRVGPYRVPDPGRVGLPPGLALCAGGPLVVTTPGAVLDGWDIAGGILVDAPDVVVTRSRITGDGHTAFGIGTTSAGSVRVEDTTFTGDFPDAAIGGERWTAERVAIRATVRDGAQLGTGSVLRNSELRGTGGLVVRGVDVLVEDNQITGGPGTDVLRVLGSAQRGGPILVRGNVLGGGRYTLYEDATSPAELWITGNRFERDAALGPLRVSPGAVLSDNAYVDGGPLPGR